MDSALLFPLFVAAAINSAIPGPVLLLVIARSAQRGLRAGLRAATGSLLAVGFLLAAVVLTMLGLLHLSEGAFVAMKIAGIGTLVVLGLRMLRAPRAEARRDVAQAGSQDVMAGLAVGVSSPFNLIFFLALIPQVLDPATWSPGHLALAGGVVLFGSLIPVTVAAVLSAGHAQFAPGWAPLIVRAGGAGLVGFAVLATASLG
jgi:threonine/homoserine/homoserine lactone efflux protein